MRTRPRLLADTTPLRESRQYRLLFLNEGLAFLGSQITVVAVPLQVYLLTHSSLAVGLVGLAQLGPLLACSLVGGAVVDAVDRRTLMLWVQLARGALSAGLVVNALAPHPSLWPLYALTSVSAGLSAFDSPARMAAVPALHQVLTQGGQVAGPAAAGLIVARASFATAYTVDFATFTAAGLLALALRRLPPGEGGTRGGPATVGLLYAAPGAGALAGALLAGWVGSVRRQGRAVLVAVAVWGLAITVFGLAAWLPLALVLLAVAGAADVFSAVFRNTILQLTVPDGLRGRLSAIHIAVVTGGPRLGDAEAGAVAALAGPRFSVVSGGLACLAGAALIAWRIPELDRVSIAPEAAPAPVPPEADAA